MHLHLDFETFSDFKVAWALPLPRLLASSHDNLRRAVHHRAPACGHYPYKTMTIFFFLFGLFVLWFFNAVFEYDMNYRKLMDKALLVQHLPFKFKYAFDVQRDAQAEQEAITQ